MGATGSNSAHLLATQTGATSISITKQPPLSSSSSSTTNVIIKPRIIKDIAGHLSSAASASSSAAGHNNGNSGSGGPSIVVSVPLSPVSGATGLGLATSVNSGVGGGLGSATASQNLFQQAIQNRSEHLNFTSRNSNSSQVAAMSRVSPVIAGGGGGGSVSHHHHEHLSAMHQRQSPLIQASNLNIDNGGRSSLSPSMQAGNPVHQSDSGMLKITYEKQAAHSAIVNPTGTANRLSALQDDVMSSGRRSR